MNESIVSYVAQDRSGALDGPLATDPSGGTVLGFNAGPLTQQVNQLLGYTQAALSARGMDTTAGYASAADAVMCPPLRVDNRSIDQAFRALALNAPGVGVCVDPRPARPRYHFVRLFGSPRHSVTIDDSRLQELVIDQSLEGCAGAVRTASRQLASSGSGTWLSYPLAPAWNDSLRPTWVLAYAGEVDGNGVPTARSQVFRRWSYAPQSLPADVELRARIAFGTWLSGEHQVEVESHDPATRTIRLKEPALRMLDPATASRINPNVPGLAQAANGARVEFRISSGGNVTVPGVRYPEFGYLGRAYQLAPLLMAFERTIELPGPFEAGFDQLRYARDAHAVISEPRLTASLPIAGMPPRELWMLERRIALASGSHGLTGYESLDAPLTGLAIEFGSGGRHTLTLSTDRTSWLRSAA